MKTEKTFLASADIARRAKCIESSYRTADGKFIISERALRDFRFQMTAEEYVTGLPVEMITEEEAQRLIMANNYAIGPEPEPTEISEEEAAAGDAGGSGEGEEDTHAEQDIDLEEE